MYTIQYIRWTYIYTTLCISCLKFPLQFLHSICLFFPIQHGDWLEAPQRRNEWARLLIYTTNWFVWISLWLPWANVTLLCFVSFISFIFLSSRSALGWQINFVDLHAVQRALLLSTHYNDSFIYFWFN